MKEIFKKWWFWVLIILVFIFFFPKYCGNSFGGFRQPAGEVYHSSECDCFGLKYSKEPLMTDGWTTYKCMGIITGKTCYEKLETGDFPNPDPYEVEC
jgi:hypothetical protein